MTSNFNACSAGNFGIVYAIVALFVAFAAYEFPILCSIGASPSHFPSIDVPFVVTVCLPLRSVHEHAPAEEHGHGKELLVLLEAFSPPRAIATVDSVASVTLFICNAFGGVSFP